MEKNFTHSSIALASTPNQPSNETFSLAFSKHALSKLLTMEDYKTKSDDEGRGEVGVLAQS